MSSPAPPAVRTVGLTRRFRRFTAVDSVSLEIQQGEVYGLLGANGAGKTTVIRMLTGLLRPSGGEVWVDGFGVHLDPEGVKHRIGYMSQRFSLYEDLTVTENLRFFGGVYGLRSAELRLRRSELLETFDLAPWADRQTGRLPAGVRQRVALAGALLHRPALLFLDEPTASVDPVSRRTFWRVIARLAAGGTTVLVTTHYMDEAEYCHRVSVMNAGRLVETGSPSDLRAALGAASMEEVFVRLVGRGTDGEIPR